MTAEKMELVRYRMNRAKETLKEAELLLSEKHVHASVNRLYYACFYAASAILLAKGYSSAKHSGIRSLLHQMIVKDGLISPTNGKVYNRLFDARQIADYADLIRFEAEDVALWLREAVDFVAEIEKSIEIL